MDDTGFGSYSFYFKLLRNFGSFPFRIEHTGLKVSYYPDGLWKWFYYVNFIGVMFGATFQAVKLLLTIQYDPDPINIIAQLCWMFAMCIPVSNMNAYLRNEEKVAQSVDSWCQLERTVIGKHKILIKF